MIFVLLFGFNCTEMDQLQSRNASLYIISNVVKRNDNLKFA